MTETETEIESETTESVHVCTYASSVCVVCVYAYVRVCKRVCLCACVRLYMRLCRRLRVCACVCVCACACACMCVCVCLSACLARQLIQHCTLRQWRLARHGKIKELEAILTALNVDDRDPKGNTCLHHACMQVGGWCVCMCVRACACVYLSVCLSVWS